MPDPSTIDPNSVAPSPASAESVLTVTSPPVRYSTTAVRRQPVQARRENPLHRLDLLPRPVDRGALAGGQTGFEERFGGAVERGDRERQTGLRVEQGLIPIWAPAAAEPFDAVIDAVMRGVTDFTPKPWLETIDA